MAEESSILTKEQLNEICGDIKLDTEAEQILGQVAGEFFRTVVDMSAQAAQNRGSDKLDLSDIKFILENYYNQSMPEHGGIDYSRQIPKPS
jgi:transcription initiation factor TFIID subunit TAF12